MKLFLFTLLTLTLILDGSMLSASSLSSPLPPNPLSPNLLEPKAIGFHILSELAHDPNSFTQGLTLNNQTITETSGLYGKSYIVQYNIKTGVQTQKTHFPNNIFAEGVTLYNKQLYILSWRAQKAFVLDSDSFSVKKTLPYQGEGWGITHNGSSIITSNGSHTITFRNPSDFSIIKTISIKDNKKHYKNINELEYAKDLIWANIWHSDSILAIDPSTGHVKGIVDLSALASINNTKPSESVLNGIAYDPSLDAFWITGKLWAKRYLVQFTWPEEPKL